MRFLATIISYLYIAGAFLSSVFSWGSVKMVPFRNDYVIPDSITEYQVIATEEKSNWQAKWIWAEDIIAEKNVWVCFSKKINVDDIPDSLVAHILADSKYWLYVNGECVVIDGSIKRNQNSCYYDSVDIAPYLNYGENVICALVWFLGAEKNYSYHSSGQGGFIFEAISDDITILSDKSWKVKQNTAYVDHLLYQPNYRLPEYSVYYNANKEIGEWTNINYDFSSWKNATEYGIGGGGVYGKIYPRGIPMHKDYGLKDYENSEKYRNYTVDKLFGEKITVDIPYNAQFTPYFKIIAPKGKTIRITTENTLITGAVSTTYVTKDGEQEFEGLGWMNGEHVTYKIPKGVTIVELKYRESGYDTSFAGDFTCDDEFLNSLWQKSLRTLYVTMRDNFMDCPDRERAQWWGDATIEMIMTMYSMDTNSYLLYQKGVQNMLAHVDENNVLLTVVPTSGEYHELPVQQLAGIVGFLTYYEYTGDKTFLDKIYDASINYLKLWDIGDNNLVIHREGSWDWADWGGKADMTAIENAWYYYALNTMEKISSILGKTEDISFIKNRQNSIKSGYALLWTEKGFMSKDVRKVDDRANALAVLSGLADKTQYSTIVNVLKNTHNASPYMEYYVLEALCKMGEYNEANARIKDRYQDMVNKDYSTLWEFWKEYQGTLNHAWSGGPLVIMSRYFAGIQPLSAGYEKVSIEPQYSNYDNLNCTVPTVKGLINLSYSKQNDKVLISLTIPEGMEGKLTVPHYASVTINGNLYYDNDQYVNGLCKIEIVRN